MPSSASGPARTGSGPEPVEGGGRTAWWTPARSVASPTRSRMPASAGWRSPTSITAPPSRWTRRGPGGGRRPGAPAALSCATALPFPRGSRALGIMSDENQYRLPIRASKSERLFRRRVTQLSRSVFGTAARRRQQPAAPAAGLRSRAPRRSGSATTAEPCTAVLPLRVPLSALRTRADAPKPRTCCPGSSSGAARTGRRYRE